MCLNLYLLYRKMVRKGYALYIYVKNKKYCGLSVLYIHNIITVIIKFGGRQERRNISNSRFIYKYNFSFKLHGIWAC